MASFLARRTMFSIMAPERSPEVEDLLVAVLVGDLEEAVLVVSGTSRSTVRSIMDAVTLLPGSPPPQALDLVGVEGQSG
jgi:hypothetical protein